MNDSIFKGWKNIQINWLKKYIVLIIYCSLEIFNKIIIYHIYGWYKNLSFLFFTTKILQNIVTFILFLIIILI